jgi:hypothetical protein
VILRRDLQTFARACETFLSIGLAPELSPEEKNFVLYYVAELVSRFGQPVPVSTDHSQLPLPIGTDPTTTMTERSA